MDTVRILQLHHG